MWAGTRTWSGSGQRRGLRGQLQATADFRADGRRSEQEIRRWRWPVSTSAVKAVYGGDSNFSGSMSNVAKRVVEKAGK